MLVRGGSSAGAPIEAGLLLCATGGASEEQADRVGTPVGASAAWDSDCGLSDENGIICESAGGACLLCIWSCAAPSGLPGPVGADTTDIPPPSNPLPELLDR